MKPRIVVVAGTGSNTGKTTLVCELLRALTGWEAIKVTRGHSRSCGRAPETCCVSPLLGEKPLVLSDPSDTRVPGKDTGKYWDAGASNVHWVIATSDQVRTGMRQALERVRAPGVIVEGTSLLEHIDADYAILVVRTPLREIKPSARRALDTGRIRALFISGKYPDHTSLLPTTALPVFSHSTLPNLITTLEQKKLRNIRNSRN
jgi:molybdopterin-guanine dinucleotide biosynthesis protein